MTSTPVNPPPLVLSWVFRGLTLNFLTHRFRKSLCPEKQFQKDWANISRHIQNNKGTGKMSTHTSLKYRNWLKEDNHLLEKDGEWDVCIKSIASMASRRGLVSPPSQFYAVWKTYSLAIRITGSGVGGVRAWWDLERGKAGQKTDRELSPSEGSWGFPGKTPLTRLVICPGSELLNRKELSPYACLKQLSTIA